MQRELTINGWYATRIRKVNDEVHAQIWRYNNHVGDYSKKQGNINIKFVNENIKSEFILTEEIWNSFIDSKLDFIKPKPYIFSDDLIKINQIVTKGMKRFVVHHNFILVLMIQVNPDKTSGFKKAKAFMPVEYNSRTEDELKSFDVYPIQIGSIRDFNFIIKENKKRTPR